MTHRLAVAMEGFDHMTTCSKHDERAVRTHRAQYVPVSTGILVIRYQRYCHAHAPIGQDVASCGQWRNVHLMPTVLVGAGCKTAKTTDRAVSNYHREIARLIYPTQAPSSLSGELILRF